MPSLLLRDIARRDQHRRLTAAALIAGLAFLAHAPGMTAAAFTSSDTVKSSTFKTGTWCGTNVYPATVQAMAGGPRNYLRLDDTGLVVSVVDSAGPPNATPAGAGLTWGAPGLLACSSSTALSLNGTGQPQVRTGGAAINGPDQFTLSMWTNLSSGDGRLIGFSNQPNGSSSRYDRHLYLDNAGYLRFGIWTGSATTIRSNAPITGGRHHIAATLGAAGMRLYVDGVLQTDVNPGVTQGEQGFTGYWRVGWDNLNLWPALSAAAPVPTGTLDEVAIWSSQLTSAQVATLAAANHD